MFSAQPIKKEIVIDGFNSIYYFEFSKNFSHAPEKHDFWEMVYVDNGEIIAVTNGVGCSLGCGQVIFHEPMEQHAHISNNLVPNNMLVISFSTKSPAMSFFSKKTFTLDKTAKTLLSLFISEAKQALGKIPDNYNIRGDLSFADAPFGSTQLLECLFTEFLIHLIRLGDENTSAITQSTKSRAIAESSIAELMKDYMQSKIYENLTLPELCAHFMLGKSQLSKIFKENTNQSPMSYYTEIKISEAKRLLRQGMLSVSEISEKLGYLDIHSFSRAFKKAVGLSPTAYIKSIF